MNNLKDKLQSLQTVPEAKPCPVGKLMETLDAETAEVLDRLLKESRTSLRAIHDSLHDEDIKIARESLSAHRNGWCRCKKVIK
jgi:hypothetical protein